MLNKYEAAEVLHEGMGTCMLHRVYGKHAKKVLYDIMAESKRLEYLLSRFIPESEISRINQSAGFHYVKVSSETYHLLSYAKQLSLMSQGMFDITISPLIDLWNYKYAKEAPNKFRIEQILSFVNYRDLLLDPKNKSVGLFKRNQMIDLGGIGKGFASDCFMELCRRKGIASAFSNIGGNVSTLGNKPDGSAWRVGIRHPRQENSLLGAVLVSSKAVVTSGDYEQYFIDSYGRRYHHILDPHTGYPAESGLISVTVIAASAMTADALSTALFVSGKDKGLALIKNFPGAEAILVDTELQVYITPGLHNNFHAANEIKVRIL